MLGKMILSAAGLPAIEFDMVSNDLSETLRWLDPEQEYCKELQTSNLIHQFENGMYSRTIKMVEDSIVVSAVHKEGCFNIINVGSVVVIDSSGKHEYSAGDVFPSPSGTQRVVLCKEYTEWTTVHNLTQMDLTDEELTNVKAQPELLFDLMTTERLHQYVTYKQEQSKLKDNICHGLLQQS